MPFEMLSTDKTLATILDGTPIGPRILCTTSSSSATTASAPLDSAASVRRGIIITQLTRRDVLIRSSGSSSTLEFRVIDGRNLTTAGLLGQIRHGYRDGGAWPVRIYTSTRQDGAEGGTSACIVRFFWSVRGAIWVMANAPSGLGYGWTRAGTIIGGRGAQFIFFV